MSVTTSYDPAAAPPGLALNETDVRYRRAVKRFVKEKLPLAESSFDERRLESFRQFCTLWLELYDWRDPGKLQDYLLLTRTERKTRFRRFRRECDSWDVSLRFSGPLPPPPPSAEEERRRRAEADRRERERRTREAREQEERARRFQDRLRDEMRNRERGRRVPFALRRCFETLQVPVGAPLPEAKAAYYRLAKENHPDRKGDAARMTAINLAWRQIADYYEKSS